MNDEVPPVDADLPPLKPVDCPSREQWERALHRKELPRPDIPEVAKWQFGMFDLFVLTIGCSFGLAGGSWMPVAVYAACLGMTVLVGMVLVPFLAQLPDLLLRRMWLALLAAYAASIAALALRS